MSSPYIQLFQLLLPSLPHTPVSVPLYKFLIFYYYYLRKKHIQTRETEIDSNTEVHHKFTQKSW